MPFVYFFGSYLVFLAALPVLLTHRKLRDGLGERLGFYRAPIPRRAGPCLWLHGASAGDLLALAPILAGLRERLPDCTLVVTTLTNSGRLMARERLPDVDAVLYLPYDLPGAVRRALKAVRPDVLVFEYTEVWPNLIAAAHQAGVRMAITNGRFSPRTLPAYRWLFRLIGNPLRHISLFLMRNEEEAERALSLGAPLERVWVTGNTKFDALATAARKTSEHAGEQAGGEALAALRVAIGERGPLLVAGSTHDGEEEILVRAWQQLRRTVPALRLLIAPRYIERAGRILALAREGGATARLRSQGASEAEVVVLDTIGELGEVYRLATLVFVGGSFTARGGQNILEPASVGKPVLFGPNMENFADSVQVLVGRGGIQVRDEAQLVRVLAELLGRPEQLSELGTMAKAAVSSVRGASARDVEHLCTLLQADPPRVKTAVA